MKPTRLLFASIFVVLVVSAVLEAVCDPVQGNSQSKDLEEVIKRLRRRGYVAADLRTAPAPFATKTQQFIVLRRNGNDVKKEDIELIAKLPNVVSLELNTCKIHDGCIEEICKITSLGELNLEDSTFPLASVKCLGKLKQLTHLQLYGTNTDNSIGDAIAGLEKLRSVSLSFTKVAKNVNLARKSKGLEELLLRSCEISDKELECIGAFTRLKQLELGNTRITDAGTVYLKSLTDIESLYINTPVITDKSLEYVLHMKELRELNLSGTRVTDEGVLTQLPQFEENCNDFQAFGRRKSLAGIASVDQGAM